MSQLQSDKNESEKTKASVDKDVEKLMEMQTSAATLEDTWEVSQLNPELSPSFQTKVTWFNM